MFVPSLIAAVHEVLNRDSSEMLQRREEGRLNIQKQPSTLGHVCVNFALWAPYGPLDLYTNKAGSETYRQ